MVRTRKQIADLSNAIYAEAMSGIQQLAESKKDVVAKFAAKDTDELLQFIVDLKAPIEAMFNGAVVDTTFLPKFLSKVSTLDGNTDRFDLNIRTRLNSPYKFAKTVNIQVSENLVEDMAQAYADALFAMFYIDIAYQHTTALTEKMAEYGESIELPYTIAFGVDTSVAGDVLEITDDKIVFNVTPDAAQNIANLAIMRDVAEDDEYSRLIVEDEMQKMTDILKTVSTPVQLLKANLPMITTLTSVTARRKASRVIRKAYHRQAQYLKAVKQGVGYFDETVKIDGKDVEVFALVRKNEDESLEVLLSPFDADTLYKVNFDVLAAVKKAIA